MSIDDMQIRAVRMKLTIPMEFPVDFDDDMINFHLSESSWCWSNIVNDLIKYIQKHPCICMNCDGYVVPLNMENERLGRLIDANALLQSIALTKQDDLMDIVKSQPTVFRAELECPASFVNTCRDES